MKDELETCIYHLAAQRKGANGLLGIVCKGHRELQSGFVGLVKVVASRRNQGGCASSQWRCLGQGVEQDMTCIAPDEIQKDTDRLLP